jgi:hypothetical protein
LDNCAYQPSVEASLDQAPRDGTVVVAGRLESADHWLAIGSQRLDQAVVFSLRVENGQAPPSLMVGRLIADPRYIDGELCAEVGDGKGDRRRIIGVSKPPLLH